MNAPMEVIDDSETAMVDEYLRNAVLETADPYDVWNMKISQLVKKVYYKNKLLGAVPAALLTLFDFYVNNNLRIGYVSRHYPIVHAFMALINLELYKHTREKKFISTAEDSLEWLSDNYSKGYSGYCWGINMPWVSKIATYHENTPHVTHTPYVLEAFISFQKETNTGRFDQIIESVLYFLDNDLNTMVDDNDMLAISYSPETETRIVVNANSYAMYCYALLLEQNGTENNHLKDKIRRLYNFILSNRQENGSWFYFADRNKGNFIDCFHSCFILKNIYKTNHIVSLPNADDVLAKGYQYLKRNFWDDTRLLFKRFSITDRPSLIKYDLYDNAEMLNLAVLLKDYDLMDMLSASIKNNFVVNDDIYSNIIYPNKRINRNTLRWAVFPYLCALCKYHSVKPASLVSKK